MNRLAKYDFSDAPIRSVYPEVSDYVRRREGAARGSGGHGGFHRDRGQAPRREDHHAGDGTQEPEYEIRDVCKYRSRCCLLLADPGLVGESRDPPAWVPLEELSRTAKNILANFKPEQFEHARKDERLDLADIGPGGR